MKKEIRFGKVSMINGVAQLEFKTVETDNTLQLMYNEIECDCIDIPFVSKTYAEYGIDVVIDDNGKIYGENTPTALVVNGIDEDRHTLEVVDYIAGTYLLVSHDSNGDTISLTEEQIRFIKNSFIPLQTQEGYLAIIPV